MKYLRVQILRFAAAAAVVLFHAWGTSATYFSGGSRFDSLRHGDLGVDLFFVISGFIIFITSQTREQDWRLFLRRRLERVVPLYWLATLTMAALLMVPRGAHGEAPTIAYVLKSLFYLTWTDGRLPVVYPGWTLEYEIAFYLLATAAMALLSRSWSGVLVVFSALTVLGAVGRILHFSSPQTNFLSDPMYLEFAFGILAGHWVLRKPPPLVPSLLIAAALLVLILTPWTERVWRLVYAGLLSGLAVLLAALWDRSRPVRSVVLMFLARLGDSSYSIYLVQVFVISILCKVFHLAWPHAPRDAIIPLVAVATIAIAYGVSIFVEVPIGRWLKRTEGLRTAKAFKRRRHAEPALGETPTPNEGR